MNKQNFWTVLTAASLTIAASPVLAGSFDAVVDLPAPGLLGLVGLGVVGAIAVAKWRK